MSPHTRTLPKLPTADADRTLASLPAIVFLLNKDGSPISMNARFYDFTGLAASTIGDRGWTSALHPEDVDPVLQRWSRSLQKSSEFESELRLRRSDGKHCWFLARISPERDDQGGVLRWVGLCTDIDAQKRAERGLTSFKADLERRVEARTSELQTALQELEGFSYTVAHDLRAPLRAMHGIAQILLEDYEPVLDERARDYVHRITEASRRMDTLVGDLLSYSRLSRQELDLHPVNLDQAVDQVVSEMSGELAERQASVRIVRPLGRVFGHDVALPLVIRNLVSNAVKFTAPGVKPEVVVRSEPAGERTRLWVEDNGIGIPAEHQERIFRVFERLHPPEAYSGTGIGLAVVRRAVERMSGTAGVKSSSGAGSRFWIELRQS